MLRPGASPAVSPSTGPAAHGMTHGGAQGASAHAGGRDEGPGRRPGGDAPRAPDVRWTPAGGDDAPGARGGYGAGRAGGPGAAGATSTEAWNAHIDTLDRWCRSDWPLSAAGRSAAASLALALGLRLGPRQGGNGRGALGEVVRLVLAAAQADVATLRAALADHRAPAARARLAGTVGAAWLLATVRLRGETIVGTELRACVSREEAAALLTTLAGGAAGDGQVPALRALVTGWVRGARRDAPLLGDGGTDVPLAGPDETQLLVLPLLSLDAPVPAAPPPAVLASMLGAAIPGGAPLGASPFLDVADPRAIGMPARDEDADVEEDEEEEDAPSADDQTDDQTDDEDQASDDEGADDEAPAAVAAPAARAPLPAAPSRPEPEPVEAEVMAAALARLRARAAGVSHVEASIASDDGVVEHVADIIPWLAEASVVEVRALARDGWAGDEAIEVARALAAEDPEVAEVVRHARRTEGELVVEIDGRAASLWLRANRPELAERLDDLLEE